MEPIALGVVIALVLVLADRLYRRSTRAKGDRRGRQIAVDGTNVLFWRDNAADLTTLGQVVRRLREEDFDPVVFLDASSRHHLGDRALNEDAFAARLGLTRNRVMVCPARTEADAFILDYARAQKIPVVSNDRFRDRPREARNIRLIEGRFEGPRLVLKNL